MNVRYVNCFKPNDRAEPPLAAVLAQWEANRIGSIKRSVAANADELRKQFEEPQDGTDVLILGGHGHASLSGFWVGAEAVRWHDLAFLLRGALPDNCTFIFYSAANRWLNQSAQARTWGASSLCLHWRDSGGRGEDAGLSEEARVEAGRHRPNSWARSVQRRKHCGEMGFSGRLQPAAVRRTRSPALHQFSSDPICQPGADERLVGHSLLRGNAFQGHDLCRIQFDGDVLEGSPTNAPQNLRPEFFVERELDRLLLDLTQDALTVIQGRQILGPLGSLLHHHPPRCVW